jgi:hypothetical protein
MTNRQKAELRQLAKEGYSFKEIRRFVDCVDSTIKQYIKVFNPNQGAKNETKSNK